MPKTKPTLPAATVRGRCRGREAEEVVRLYLALLRRRCPVPLTVRGTQTLVSFAPLAFKLFYAARQNAVLRRSSFRDAGSSDRPKPIGRNDTTPKDVANTVHVRSSFRYEAQGRTVTTNQWGLFRDAGSFDQPRSIERNAATPGNVANTVHVRRSRGNKNAPLCGREILERITRI